MSNLKQVQPGTMPLASDVNQVIQALLGLVDLGTLKLASPVAPPSAPSIVGVTGSATLTGTYKYQLVYVTGWVDSYYNLWVNGFVPSAESTITLNAQNASITIPSFPTNVIAVLIYRTAAGGASGTEKYAGAVWNGLQTTYVDAALDASLGTGMLGASTTPIAYGTAIPASVPTSNSSGTFLQVTNVNTTVPAGPNGTVAIINGILCTSNGTAWIPAGGASEASPMNWIY